MLDEAIDLLPPAKLAKLAGRYLDPRQLGNLLASVKVFEQSSLRGEYYESFAVNSTNFMETSGQMRAWIAECRRLLDRCVAEARKGDAAQVREAFEILFGLLRHIDEGRDDVIFFADEGGSWQVGVDWSKVLPPWFTCCAATSQPEEFARRIGDVSIGPDLIAVRIRAER